MPRINTVIMLMIQESQSNAYRCKIEGTIYVYIVMALRAKVRNT
jgi:hypothetical protein